MYTCMVLSLKQASQKRKRLEIPARVGMFFPDVNEASILWF